MKLSDNGRRLLQGFEGLSLTAYPDATGYSIGYGHFGAQKGQTITRAEAERLFDQDVEKFEAGVSRYTPYATQQQFDAMVSLAYNIGVGAPASASGSGSGFAASTVARLHNLGDHVGAANAFRMWTKSRKAAGAPLEVNPVLAGRREKELAVYLTGYGTPYSTPPMTPAPPSAPAAPPPPAASSAPSSSTATIVATGLLFFCPSCGAHSASVGVVAE